MRILRAYKNFKACSFFENGQKLGTFLHTNLLRKVAKQINIPDIYTNTQT